MRIFTKLILISVGGFIVSVIIFAFLIRPNLNQVGDLYNAGIAKQTQLNNLSDQIIAYKNSQSDLSAVSNTDKIQNSILPRDNLQTAIQEVEAAALASNTEEGMTIQEPLNSTDQTLDTTAKQIITGNPDIEEIPYTVSISSTFTSLVTFLQYIEHLPNFSEVSKLTVSAATSDTATAGSGEVVHSGDLTGAINAVFFVQRPKP
ncbi:MAG: hypothetical protein WDN47_02745 [Candidatus Doudnabacteria bacterium]